MDRTELDHILGIMWKIDEEMRNDREIDVITKAYYKEHLALVTAYYESNARYWRVKSGKKINLNDIP